MLIKSEPSLFGGAYGANVSFLLPDNEPPAANCLMPDLETKINCIFG